MSGRAAAIQDVVMLLCLFNGSHSVLYDGWWQEPWSNQ